MMRTTTPLPQTLQPVFWDYPFSKLSWKHDRELIIRRVLANGSWESVRWLRNALGDDRLRKWLISRKGKGLSPRQLRYWALVLRIPKKDADMWVKSASENPWGKR
jgi:hypothetical protein